MVTTPASASCVRMSAPWRTPTSSSRKQAVSSPSWATRPKDDRGRSRGTQIKQTAKQVTGLGRGSVKLELDQTKTAPGGTIQGRVVLALSEPVEAKRLVVTLRARQKMVTVKRDDGGRSVGTSHADVYEFELELGGAKKYEPRRCRSSSRSRPTRLELRRAHRRRRSAKSRAPSRRRSRRRRGRSSGRSSRSSRSRGAAISRTTSTSSSPASVDVGASRARATSSAPPASRRPSGE